MGYIIYTMFGLNKSFTKYDNIQSHNTGIWNEFWANVNIVLIQCV